MDGVDSVREGVEDAQESAGWFSELVSNLWALISPYIPWWIWPVAALVLVLVLVLRSKAGRDLLKRFALGLPLDGVPRTDARALRYATRRLDNFSDTDPGPWHDKPYALRALIRWGVLVWLAALVGGYAAGSVGSIASAWAVFAAAVAAPMLWALIRWRRQVARASRATARWVATHKPAIPQAPRRALGSYVRPLALEAGAPEPEEAPEGSEEAPEGVVALREGAGPPAEAAPAEGGALASPEGGLPLSPAEAARARQEAEDDRLAEDAERDMEGEILQPLWDGVRPALELSRKHKDQPHKWVSLPKSVDVDDAQVVIRLPRTWQGTAEERARLDHAVTTRLPGEWDAFYKLAGREHTASYRRVPRPPQKVRITDQVNGVDVWSYIRGASPDAPVFAIGPRGVPIAASLVEDSPHIAISMGSGAGKSTLTRALLAQMLHNGATAHIMDIKRTSHRWAKGLPNVKVYKDVEDIHDALVDLGEEADRRHKAQDDEEIEFPRMILVLEEMNILADALEDYWEECKANDKDLPKKSPAFKGLAKISYGGRSVYANIIAIAQKLDARLFGSRSGGAVRENFALRILARFTVQAWKQLADIKPMAKLAKILGRVAVVVQGEWLEAQVIYWPEEVAREWAVSGVVTPVTPPAVTAEVVSEEPVLTSVVSQDGASQDWVRDTDPRGGGTAVENVVDFRRPLDPAPWEDVPEPEEKQVLVSQAEVYRRLHTSVTYDNFRQIYNRERKKGMAPGPAQEKPSKLWDLDAMADWWADRQEEKSS